jgi:drug/metabolite transporter (DMT)-like permease|nr:DMT family transporter [Limnohabitans sp. Rim8]
MHTMSALHSLTRKQLLTLVILTLVWGMNWPILKIGVTGYPAITFRSISMWIGWPLLGLVLLRMKVPFKVPRHEWRELVLLAISNMFVWHVLIILAVQDLSSGRAAILGYTMPIFSAVMGVLFFKSPLRPRAWLGVALAALAAMLLLWHELAHLSGKPLGVLIALLAAASWALGTQQIRHTKMTVPTLTIVFWMTGMTAVVMSALAVVFEMDRWAMPPAHTWGSIIYNAIGVFVFAQAAWLSLARSLPPLASSLSVMFIPVLGVFAGAWWLGEVLHWQDWLAVLLVVAAIASVLWPARASQAEHI